MGTGADERHAGHLQQRLDRAVLAPTTVQRHDGRVRPVLVQPGQQSGIRVAYLDRVPGVAKCLCQAGS